MENSSDLNEDFNICDKRVDKRLQTLGFRDADIYYSPVKVWMFYVFIFVIGSIPLYGLLVHFYYIIPPFIAVSYLVNAYKSNSFALTDNQLVIINPNFPFRKITVIEFKEIELVKIDRTDLHWFISFMILAFGNNYVEVKTVQGSKRYYCAFLNEWNGFSRNLTEKGIDDLNINLKNKGIATTYNPDVE